MRIVAVAFTDGNVTLSAERPKRHFHIVHAFGGELENWHTWRQGFLTDDGKFVGREEAAKIALASGQCAKLYAPPDLYSEDLW